METKHTEGTWKTGPCTEGIEVFVRGTAIARCPKSFSDEEFNKEVEANAKLIAAAPELLEALVGLINGINPQDACRGKYKDFYPENPEIAKEAYVGAKSMPADEQILKALEAIEKATK